MKNYIATEQIHFKDFKALWNGSVQTCDYTSRFVHKVEATFRKRRGESEILPYREFIGSLTYLTVTTRPDISLTTVMEEFIE